MNTATHPQLIDLGYEMTHHLAEIYDYGDVESGPMIDYCPEYYEYVKGDDIFIFDSKGKFLARETDVQFLEPFDDPMGDMMGRNE